MNAKTFRVLLSIEIILVILSVVADISLEKHLPPILQDYLTAELENEFTTFELIFLGLALITLLYIIINYIQLFMLARSARIHATIVTFLSYPLAIGLGPNVTHETSSLLYDTSTVFWGFLLGVMYFSDIKVYFDNKVEEED
jgi:hypothetical protein